MVGAGGHLTWIEPAHDAVVVVRWMDPAFTAGFTSAWLRRWRWLATEREA